MLSQLPLYSKLCIYRLERTKWTLEVVDAEGNSTVWGDEFESDDDALAEFERTVQESGMLEFMPAEAAELRHSHDHDPHYASNFLGWMSAAERIAFARTSRFASG